MFLFVLLALSVPVSAGAKYKNQWRSLNGRYYYYNAKGKAARGLVKIKKKKYYFDSKGIQHTGWQKIGKYYYYFNVARSSGGSMVTGTYVNGVRLYKTGRAKITADSREKLELMVQANKVTEKITNWSMDDLTRLRKCFDYTKNTFKYTNWRRFSPVKNWDRLYAGDMLYRGRGNCYSYAAAFAYLANAAGFEASVVSSGGHGWAEVNGRVFDPDWALVSRVDSYFNMSYDLSGVGGRPSYKRNRLYVVKV